MEALITILLTPIRAGFALLVITSFSAVFVKAVAVDQSLYNPFTSYTDTLLGKSWENVSQWGFICQFNPVVSPEESCSLLPENNLFSEIRVKIEASSGRVTNMTFTPHEDVLTIGQLTLLWGKPEIVVLGQTSIFRWGNIHVTAIPKTYPGHFSYWISITYLDFESAQ